MSIFLSKGIISGLKIKKKAFDIESKNKQEINAATIDLTSNQSRPYIVKCLEIRRLENEYHIVFLSDDEETIFLLIDETEFIETTSFKSNESNKFNLDVNSVLILGKICLAKKSQFCETIQRKLSNHDSVSYFLLKQATLIGSSNANDKNASDDEDDDVVCCNRSNDNVISQTGFSNYSYQRGFINSFESESNLILISSLNINKDKIGLFHMILWLTDKKIDSFVTKSNKMTRIRFRLKDRSGLIEAVAYHKVAERFKHLDVNKFYLFRNIFINPYEPNGREWPRQSSSSIYDIILNTETSVQTLNDLTIEPIIIENKNIKNTSSVKFVPKSFNKKETTISEQDSDIIILKSTKRLASSLSSFSISDNSDDKRSRIDDIKFDSLEISATSTQN